MKKILILEDDFDLAMYWKERLEDDGYGVVYTSTSEEATQVLCQDEFDLVIADVLIRTECGAGPLKPTGGLSLIAHVTLRVDPRPKIVAVSGAHPQSNVLKHATALKADRVMVKPFRIDSLVDVVKDLVGESL